MIRIFVLILLLLLLPFSAFADYYQSIQESNGEYTLVLHVDPNQLKFQNADKIYTEIELSDAKAIGKPGDPALPVISRFFNVKATEYMATIAVSDPVVFSGVKVYPIQPDHTENSSKKAFAYNEASYAKDQQPAVSLGELVSIGNGKALAVRVNPFARHGNQLTLFKTIIIRLKPTPTAKSFSQKTDSIAQSLFQSDQQDLLVFTTALKDKSPSSTLFGKVLVLTSDELLADAKAYANFHPFYRMEIVAVKKGITSQEVKQMITERYAQGGLDTVVLYGDESHVPHAFWKSPEGGDTTYDSDSFYQYLDALRPNYTSIAIGRIPAQNHQDAAFYNGKLADYLKNNLTHPTKKVMLIAHREEYPKKYTENQEAIRHLPNPMGFDFHTEYGGLNGTNENVIQEASNRYALINYRGHGSEDSWWSWDKNQQSFGAEQISLLKNTDQNVSVVFNIACLTGAFMSPVRNMSENLIFAENKSPLHRGAVAVLAATAPSYTILNNEFDIHIFQFLEAKKSLPLGHLIALANDRLVLEHLGKMQDNVQMYVLLGDPLITLW